MGTVALDAGVVIGALHPPDAHHAEAVALLEEHAADRIVMGATAYSECLVGAVRRQEVWRVDGMLDDARAEIVPATHAIARRAAELRARHRALRLPDAFALATALDCDATLLTFDRSLQAIAKRES